MKRPLLLALLVTCAALVGASAKQAPAPEHGHTHGEHEDHGVDLWSGEGVSLGGILFPDFHFQSAAGDSTAEPAELAVGHHDPDRRGITIQNIEFGLVARLSERCSLVAHYAVKIDLDDHWNDELEELYFNARDLPARLALRVGRFYARIGRHNLLHPHDFTFVDQHLASGRMVGEDSFTLHGAQLSLPVARGLPMGWSDRITLAFGKTPKLEEEGEEQAGGAEDAAVADLLGGTEGAHAASEIDGESALHDGWTFVADYSLSREWNKHRAELGLSGAWGENRARGDTQLYALHGEYLWRSGAAHEHHVDVHGKYFRVNGELWARQWDAPSAGGDRGFTDAGAWVAASYGFPRGGVSAHLRGEYVSGIADVELEERWRISPALTWRPIERVNARLVAQYNYDHFPTSRGDEHSFWLQISITWGSHID